MIIQVQEFDFCHKTANQLKEKTNAHIYPFQVNMLILMTDI